MHIIAKPVGFWVAGTIPICCSHSPLSITLTLAMAMDKYPSGIRLSPATSSLSILYICSLQSSLKDFILYIFFFSNNAL
jgi:hypothetical protein